MTVHSQTSAQIPEAKPVIQVAVRELVDFVCRTGDLAPETDFVGAQRALAGIRGHQRIQKSRPEGYQKEVAVSLDIETANLTLRIQGRIDGLLLSGAEALVEEIKTVQPGWKGIANPLHWAQLKIYAAIYARGAQIGTLRLQLTYFDLESGRRTELIEAWDSRDLDLFLQDTVGTYLEWLQQHHDWCRQRDQSIRALAFPFEAYRPRQRELAIAAFRAMARRQRLFLEAPTGIGKTVSVIFPAFKAMADGKLERIFYLTARSSGRTVAEGALADLREAGLRACTLTLTAKDKVCVQNDQPCDPRSCSLALGYYDRRKPAMRAALERETITRCVLEEISREHQVCPFELSLDLSTWVDAVICDYNYVFDPAVYLRRHFDEQPRPYVFLIDEAHNLVDRAREMFSAGLDSREIREVRRAVKDPVPRCARAMSKLNSTLRSLGGRGVENEPRDPVDPSQEMDLFPGSGSEEAAESTQKAPADRTVIARNANGGALLLREVPEALLEQVDAVLKEAEAWLACNEPAEFRQKLLEFYFHLLTFRRTAQAFDEHYVMIVESQPVLKVRLFCLDPSQLLRQALDRGISAVLFSATLSPLDYYRDLIGAGPDDPTLRLPSPFPPEHLRVLVQDRIRMEYKHRQDSVADVVETIAAATGVRAGNYLVYFSSYEYLERVRVRFQQYHPEVRLLVQQSDMSEVERDRFLAAFSEDHEETLVGFAVLGGIFGEGIDLVGERLIGAIAVGAGLPQLCLERDLIRDYFDGKLGSGFDYAYTFPGMNRVLQAIGRVIRSETDRGIALLVDARFRQLRYQRLFPRWWRPTAARSAEQVKSELTAFWSAEFSPPEEASA